MKSTRTLCGYRVLSICDLHVDTTPDPGNRKFQFGGFHMKRILTVVFCLSLFPIAALTETKATKQAEMRDQRFVNFVAQTDMVEANLGQLAKTAGASQSVIDCAQTLVTDHTSDFQALSDLAYKAGLLVPRAIDDENNRAVISPFQKLKGNAFDRRYIQLMIAEHAKAIAAYRKEAADAKTTALKSYAEKTLPVLQKLLADTKDAEKTKAS
jgi:putative membrane protein